MKKGQLICALAVVFILSACKKEENYNSNTPNNIVPTVEQVSVEFVSDTPREQWNEYGNDFSNLSQFSSPSGRMAKQGEWIYYYSQGGLYKKQGDEAEIYIASANDAYSLNVVGDWIYYKEGENVYKIRTDGEHKDVIFENVVSNIFVVGNDICYVTKENKSATTYTYYINVRNMNLSIELSHVELGENPFVVIGFRPDLGKIYGYFENYITPKTFSVYEVEYLGWTNEVLTSTFEGYGWSSDDYLFAMMSGDIIVLNAFHEGNPMGENIIKVYNIADGNVVYEMNNECYRKIVTANIFGEKIIGTPDSNSGRLLAVNTNKVKEEFEDGSEFLKESTVYREVYVFDDYVYYTLAETGVYNERPIYRIKVDGTNWTQFR